MYEIKRSSKVVNGVEVETWVAEFISANILEVEVGTTGYMGGDTGHGGRTYLRITDLASTDLSVNGKDSEEVVIELGGDTELATFTQVLEFALKVLKDKERDSQ